jgi:hypothetical protein
MIQGPVDGVVGTRSRTPPSRRAVSDKLSMLYNKSKWWIEIKESSIVVVDNSASLRCLPTTEMMLLGGATLSASTCDAYHVTTRVSRSTWFSICCDRQIIIHRPCTTPPQVIAVPSSYRQRLSSYGMIWLLEPNQSWRCRPVDPIQSPAWAATSVRKEGSR